MSFFIDDGYGRYDTNFACCGGCSSATRADGSAKLATGSRVFIWDVQLKTAPAPVCLRTFPYAPELSEQVGARRVRSGRLVGTNYPIDHDYDARCCEQRGQCLALDEDASGKCRCVARWGFTGDHCELSIYEAAALNNTKHFPAAANLSNVHVRLPDLRHYLVSFDHASAIEASATHSTASTSTSDSLLEVFSAGSYRQFGWSMSAYFAALAAVLSLAFLFHVIWRVCCVACRCRKRDPTKQQRIYAKRTKVVYGTLACVFVGVGAAAAAFTYLTLDATVVPVSKSIGLRLERTLVADTMQFQRAFVTPLNEVLAVQDAPLGLRSLRQLQAAATDTMAPHTFFANQTYELDRLRLPVFERLTELETFTALYPTAIDSQANCSSVGLTPNIGSRMTIGAATGCFRCKACATLTDLVTAASDRWRRGPFQVQMDLLIAQRQLQAFGATRTSLVPAVTQLCDRVNTSCTVFIERTTDVAAAYDKLRAEVYSVAVYGSLGLLALSGFAALLAIAGVSHGVTTNKRTLARSACFVAEVACVAAVVLTGVLYTVAMMAHDGVVALEIFNASSAAFFASSDVARDIHSVLFDANIVTASGYDSALAFADTLRVPPHPTPSDDNPSRVDVPKLYTSVFADLFALEHVAAQPDAAITELFGYDDAFVATQRSLLVATAFGNASIVSPYNETIHYELLNSTMARLMDSDNDGALVTSMDAIEIERVFNASWRGVSDRGAFQNTLILDQWRVVAQLGLQRQRLVNYTTSVASIIASVRPVIDELIQKTSAMEAAEFELKRSVEFYTDAIRASKIHDCAYNNNCGWLRVSLNELFALFQNVISNAERAAVVCAVCAASMLFGLVLVGCFADRLHRKTVKVYVGS